MYFLVSSFGVLVKKDQPYKAPKRNGVPLKTPYSFDPYHSKKTADVQKAQKASLRLMQTRYISHFGTDCRFVLTDCGLATFLSQKTGQVAPTFPVLTVADLAVCLAGVGHGF